MRASKRIAVIMALSSLDDTGSSNPYFYPDGLGNALRMFPHLLLRFGFDHDPRQRPTPRIAHHAPPIAMQIRLRPLNTLHDARNLLQRPFFADPHIDDHL